MPSMDIFAESSTVSARRAQPPEAPSEQCQTMHERPNEWPTSPFASDRSIWALPSSRCILGNRKRGTHGDDFAAESAGLDRYRGPSCARDEVHSLVRLVSFCGGGFGCRGGLLGYFVAHVDRPGFVLDARPFGHPTLRHHLRPILWLPDPFLHSSARSELAVGFGRSVELSGPSRGVHRRLGRRHNAGLGSF